MEKVSGLMMKSEKSDCLDSAHSVEQIYKIEKDIFSFKRNNNNNNNNIIK